MSQATPSDRVYKSQRIDIRVSMQHRYKWEAFARESGITLTQLIHAAVEAYIDSRPHTQQFDFR